MTSDMSRYIWKGSHCSGKPTGTIFVFLSKNELLLSKLYQAEDLVGIELLYKATRKPADLLKLQ